MYAGRDFDIADPGENEPYTLDFVNDLASGDSIVGATVTLVTKLGTDSSSSSHLSGSPTISGTYVTQRVADLTAGNIYILRAVVVTSGANTQSLYSHIPCEAVY